MSKDECLYADWRAVGYEDGAAGKPVSAVSAKRSACAKKAGVTVDMSAYNAGRVAGLKVYCKPTRGFSEGVRGGGYYGVCTGPEQYEFSAAYQAGRQLYLLERTAEAIAADIRQAQYDLHDVKHRITRTETALITPDTPGPERIKLLADLKGLSEEKGAIELSLIGLNREHASAQEDLRLYREEIAYSGPFSRPVIKPTAANY